VADASQRSAGVRAYMRTPRHQHGVASTSSVSPATGSAPDPLRHSVLHGSATAKRRAHSEHKPFEFELRELTLRVSGSAQGDRSPPRRTRDGQRRCGKHIRRFLVVIKNPCQSLDRALGRVCASAVMSALTMCSDHDDLIHTKGAGSDAVQYVLFWVIGIARQWSRWPAGVGVPGGGEHAARRFRHARCTRGEGSGCATRRGEVSRPVVDRARGERHRSESAPRDDRQVEWLETTTCAWGSRSIWAGAQPSRAFGGGVRRVPTRVQSSSGSPISQIPFTVSIDGEGRRKRRLLAAPHTPPPNPPPHRNWRKKVSFPHGWAGQNSRGPVGTYSVILKDRRCYGCEHRRRIPVDGDGSSSRWITPFRITNRGISVNSAPWADRSMRARECQPRLHPASARRRGVVFRPT